MKRSAILSAVLGVGITWCATGPARASLVTWEFAGHLTDVNDVAGVLPESITVGMPLFGSYTFESDVPDTRRDNPLTGVYSAIVEYSVQVGDVTFVGPLGPNSIIVLLGSPALPSQGYGTNVGVEWGGFLADTGINLTAAPGAVFVTDELPLVPPPLEAFDLASLDISSRDKSFFLEGTVTSLVPEPATLLLLALGGVLASRRTSRCYRPTNGVAFRSKPATRVLR